LGQVGKRELVCFVSLSLPSIFVFRERGSKHAFSAADSRGISLPTEYLMKPRFFAYSRCRCRLSFPFDTWLVCGADEPGCSGWILGRRLHKWRQSQPPAAAPMSLGT
jgi:hypothetical protein